MGTPTPQAAQQQVQQQAAAADDGFFHRASHTSDFYLYSFKILPCSKAYPHNWSCCPLMHPGEKARRRDPRTHSYRPLPCPYDKKGTNCPYGDACSYTHNVYEYHLHPSRFRTAMCKEGAACNRPLCFFAHSLQELRVASAAGPSQPSQPSAAAAAVPGAGVHAGVLHTLANFRRQHAAAAAAAAVGGRVHTNSAAVSVVPAVPAGQGPGLPAAAMPVLLPFGTTMTAAGPPELLGAADGSMAWPPVLLQSDPRMQPQQQWELLQQQQQQWQLLQRLQQQQQQALGSALPAHYAVVGGDVIHQQQPGTVLLMDPVVDDRVGLRAGGHGQALQQQQQQQQQLWQHLTVSPQTHSSNNLGPAPSTAVRAQVYLQQQQQGGQAGPDPQSVAAMTDALFMHSSSTNASAAGLAAAGMDTGFSTASSTTAGTLLQQAGSSSQAFAQQGLPSANQLPPAATANAAAADAAASRPSSSQFMRGAAASPVQAAVGRPALQQALLTGNTASSSSSSTQLLQGAAGRSTGASLASLQAQLLQMSVGEGGQQVKDL